MIYLKRNIAGIYEVKVWCKKCFMYKVNVLIIKQLNRRKGVILKIQTLITAIVSFILQNPEELVIQFS